MIIILFNVFLLCAVAFLLVVLSMVWPPDSPWAPWWKIDKKRASVAGKLAKVTKNDIIYELGSGDGEFLLQITKEYGVACVGIEIDPLRYWISQIRKQLHHATTVTFVRKNFNAVQLSEATVIFVYLVPRALERLKPKLLKELKPGTRIISYRYEMSLPLIKTDKKNQLYLYQIPAK